MKYQMLQVNNWEVSAGLRITAVISTQKSPTSQDAFPTQEP